MDNYKLYLEHGDKAITKSTSRRYRLYNEDSEVQHFTNENYLQETMDYDQINEPTEPPVHSIYDADDIPHYDWAHELMDDLDESFHYDNSSYPKNFQDFISSEYFSSVVTIPVDKTIGEIFLMIIKFSVMNSLSASGMTNLFQLINMIFKKPILPESKYIIDCLLNSKNNTEYHAVCPECSAYIGDFDTTVSVKNCTICQCDLNIRNPSDPSFFMLINPTVQISDFIKMNDDYYDFVTKDRVYERGFIKDVYDGKEYRKFIKSLPENEKYSYVTCVFNTDGAPKFKSSQFSIWPLYLQINELPPQERLNKLVTCGLYFGKKKPEMTVFIDKFVDLMNNVRKEGISCFIKGTERKLKLYVLTCCADAVARAPIQGLKQYNGYFGCNFCLHPGQYESGSVKYNNVFPVPPHRNHEETIKLMLLPESQKNYGIKYASPLINLPNFDIVKGFLPDYLHSCLEGVAAQFTSYFLDSQSDDTMRELDKNMYNITVPNQIARLSRPLSVRNNWKAKEWENFILYYSVPLLQSVISRKKYNHWILFVEGVFILLQDKIHIDELNHADDLLHRFVIESQELYGMKAMTYNLHLMLHLSESVLNWGPLWTSSSFSFETQNYYLLKAIKSSKGVTQQIVRYLNIIHNQLIIEKYVGRTAKVEVMKYCNDILTSKIKNTYRTTENLYFGRSVVDDHGLDNLGLIQNTASFYLKLVKDKVLYESCLIKKKRSRNCYAQLHDGRFAQIVGFIVDNNGDEKTVCHILDTRQYLQSLKMMHEINQITNINSIVPTTSIKAICVKIDTLLTTFICPLPNLMHY